MYKHTTSCLTTAQRTRDDLSHENMSPKRSCTATDICKLATQICSRGRSARAGGRASTGGFTCLRHGAGDGINQQWPLRLIQPDTSSERAALGEPQISFQDPVKHFFPGVQPCLFKALSPGKCPCDQFCPGGFPSWVLEDSPSPKGVLSM